MMTSRVVLVLLLWMPLGCRGDSAAKWQPLAEGQASAAQRAQIDRGQKAWQALGQALLGELTAAIETKGPAAAIDVCRTRAPRLAERIAGEQRVRIGRTAQRLRNPANAAPAWAAASVARAKPKPERFAGPEGAVGLLQPILLMPVCTQCHGPQGQLAPGVADALGRLYPDDRATGFAAGDLRGWFWVEVPRE